MTGMLFCWSQLVFLHLFVGGVAITLTGDHQDGGDSQAAASRLNPNPWRVSRTHPPWVPAIAGAACTGSCTEPRCIFGSTTRWLIQAKNVWVRGCIVKSCLETGTVIYCSAHDIVSHWRERESETERERGRETEILLLWMQTLSCPPAHNLINCL